MNKSKWRVFLVLNTLGVFLGTIGTMDAQNLALPVGMILLLPGTIPVVLYIGQLTIFFNFLGVYGDHFACALTAALINLLIWVVIDRLFHFKKARNSA